MPTIVADLGGLPFYSWVFSAYMLTRAVSLPIFGKLCDLFGSKKLYIAAILIFIVSSTLAGLARSMEQLILWRSIQGIGAGGTFALCYIALSDLYPPETRGKMMGMISVVWGISSILGPPVGGFIVAWSSWHWIFFINLPLGCLALLGIVLYLSETRQTGKRVSIDYAGALTLSISVIALLCVFLLGGRTFPWISPEVGGLLAVTIGAGLGFCLAESKAKEPILALHFFWKRRFSMANGSAFFSSFAIFALSAFSPLFIQGVLGKSPAELGVIMIPLTLGWSVGAITCGQLVSASREKALSIAGSIFLVTGSGLALAFASPAIPAFLFAGFISLAGMGMGFVSIPTLLIVQKSLDPSELGVATSSQQFARTVGGTIGIGISGGLVTTHMAAALNTLLHSPLKDAIPQGVAERLASNVEILFEPQFQDRLSAAVQEPLRRAIGESVEIVFWSALITSLISLVLCCFLPGHGQKDRPTPLRNASQNR